MEIGLNQEPAEVMHIDLNSAFAMTEQQANPLLRGVPVGITNRINDYSICITSSYEARALGITIGTRYKDAKKIAPNFIMLESDPAKYQYVHRKLRSIFESYSDDSYMKSIDEGIIDFRKMRRIMRGRPLEEVGLEIKQRIKEEVGDYMTVNIGIGQNLWLAKVAASFMKPDGMFRIDSHNIEAVYGMMRLTDLPYIAKRNKVRLNMAGIYSPLDFLNTTEIMLTKQVFKSINGHHWYLKLRGYETEVQYGIKTVGRSYVLEHRTADPEEIATLFYKAAAKVARRLRQNDLASRGLMMGLGFQQKTAWDGMPIPGPKGWYERHMYKVPVRRADQLFARCMDLFSRFPQGEIITSLWITAYAVEKFHGDQLRLVDSDDERYERVEDALNLINDRYGEQVAVTAAVLSSKNPMKDKIPFGTVRYFS